ncbi:Xenotropic and polytropic retrovirus receptor 1 [Emydomyces testavorans]|uniref:Xenotropic and polytropic retrovirus receptor 1 n=1 Tax=Emydomyces testavorans TaxID=2070801 RepID=A0AAF0DCX4_9EURO|nr:Xenotropic and polytropic retrovirus receptor 1 [Emydomyces testavorans]
MKFAKELEQELVPEWRAKYLNYKKKIKAIARAIRAIEQAPRTPGRRGFSLTGYDGLPHVARPALYQFSSYRGIRSKLSPNGRRQHDEAERQSAPASIREHEPSVPERQPLKSPTSRFADHTGGYGSIVSPQSNAANSTGLPSLELPGPALDPSETNFPPQIQRLSGEPSSSNGDAQPGRSRGRKSLASGILPKSANIFTPRSDSVPSRPVTRRDPFLKRMFTSRMDRESSVVNPPDEAFWELRNKENEFFSFLDNELAKIEAFYKLKEEEATERLKVLREQLHVMRDMRLEELRSKARSRKLGDAATAADINKDSTAAKLKKPLNKSLNGLSKIDKMSKEFGNLPTPASGFHCTRDTEGYRDFVRRQEHDVSYQSARRKLKVALLEFYRGLELLKAYAYLNRKAFRKMNKKYDKATNARPTGRYMSEKVNKAWFVQSDLVENHLVAVEDLYTRYFERGNRKVAVTKLRGKTKKSQDYSPSSFRNGLMFAAGIVFGSQGLIYGVEHLFHDGDASNLKVQTSYLLQWRLLLAGLYPVEFRDFFLGDMYCSQTYAMGNLALFFCLYSAAWSNPAHCNSSHSRIMGFLTTLPSIWRALQCLRRYRDTRNPFPHIVNFGKYACSILYYMTLSFYRINKVESLRAIFITCALVNAIYSSVWDVAMDWSLGNPYSKNPFLREFLGFRKQWIYYAAIVVDPILRFNWIFYAICTSVQHSALLSFAISLSEVCRRGIWSIFRVENEHCTNVCRFRASRDVPLPYDIPTDMSADFTRRFAPTAPEHATEGVAIVHLPPSTPTTGADVEHLAVDIPASGLRHRRGLRRPETPTVPSGTLARVGSLLANAHAQDFERRKRPGVIGKTHDHHDEECAHRHGGRHDHSVHRRDSSSDDEEDEEEEEEDVVDGSESENERDQLDHARPLRVESGSLVEDVEERLRN